MLYDAVEQRRLQALSVALTGNNVTLPVAVAIGTLPTSATVSAPELTAMLGGTIPTNRIGRALRDLAVLNVLRELPYPGRPHRRIYERVDGPYWTFINDWAADPVTGLAASER